MISHLFKNGTCTFLSGLATKSEAGMAVGALVGLGLGVVDYLQMRQRFNGSSPLDNVLSVVMPAYLGAACGVIPGVGIPTALAAIAVNEHELQRNEEEQY